MAFIHIGQIQLQAIDKAIQCLDGVTARIKNRDESDVYRLVRPDFDEGLQVALMPYESLFRNGSLPWGDVSTSAIQDYLDDLNDAWGNLFSALTRRVADKTSLDLARTKQEAVHSIFKDISKAPSGYHVPKRKPSELEGLRSALSDLSTLLCSSDCVSRQEIEGGKTKKGRHHGRSIFDGKKVHQDIESDSRKHFIKVNSRVFNLSRDLEWDIIDRMLQAILDREYVIELSSKEYNALSKKGKSFVDYCLDREPAEQRIRGQKYSGKARVKTDLLRQNHL